MKTEYEAKFLHIDIDAIRQKLRDAGAMLEEPMRLMRRVTIETDDLKKKNAFVRVRDEGHRVTITYKQFDALSVDGAKEHEVIVNDFDEAVALLGAAGLEHRSFQESKRETWRHGAVEVVIDEWPWLAPYIEVESISETEVKAFSEKLGLDWDTAAFGDVMVAYRAQYPHLAEKDTIATIPKAKFGDPLPELFKNEP